MKNLTPFEKSVMLAVLETVKLDDPLIKRLQDYGWQDIDWIDIKIAIAVLRSFAKQTATEI